jgi:ankyrin repeat protein
MTKLGYYYGVKYFLSVCHADPNKYHSNYCTPLMIATEMGYAHFIDLLAKYGADMNQTDEDGWSALSFAAANIDHVPNGLGSSAQALIRNGADINHRNNRGQTPLALAIHYGNDVVAAILRRLGASM